MKEAHHPMHDSIVILDDLLQLYYLLQKYDMALSEIIVPFLEMLQLMLSSYKLCVDKIDLLSWKPALFVGAWRLPRRRSFSADVV